LETLLLDELPQQASLSPQERQRIFEELEGSQKKSAGSSKSWWK